MTLFEELHISCSDAYILQARFYPHQQTKQNFPILIAPATGIKQNFYQSFAQWLSQQGYDVMTFDFRGIGASLYEPLKHSEASILDWGQRDLPACLDALLNKTQAKKAILIGHSAGGQLLGVMHNYHKIEKLISIAGSTGYVKGLKGRTKILAPIMFNVIFPISCWTHGYGATKMIGMGENLPKHVAKQWAKFCSQPGYVMNATLTQHYHEQIECPIISFWASDDEIATATNVKDLQRLYPKAQTQMIELKPQHYQQTHIGHMSMFKKSHQNLWPILAAALTVH